MDLRVPFFDAIVIGDDSVVNHLIELGCDILMTNEYQQNALHISSISLQSEKLVPFLISKGVGINDKDYLGHTPLYYHSEKGRIYGVTCLLYNGAEPNGACCGHQIDNQDNSFNSNNSIDRTPLQAAILHGHSEVVRILLGFGADSNNRSKEH